jgi:hypothetical protein
MEHVTITWQFPAGALVYINHGGEPFLIEAQRYTRNPCSADRHEYFVTRLASEALVNRGPLGFWVHEDVLTRADT